MAMSDWFLLRLSSSAGGSPEWVIADSAGRLLPVAEADDASLASLAAGRQVALVVPAADVSLFAAQLPAGNEARLLQLVPFALEEQVSEDLERLHFAVGTRDGETGQVSVAVADREHMQQWLAQAAALSVQPRAMFAESDLAPRLPGHVTMLLDGDQLVLRNDGGRPVDFPADDPALALSTLLGSDADLAGVHLVVYASPVDWSYHQHAVEQLRERLASFNVQLFSGGLMALFAQGIAASAPVNLLQGAFKPQVPGASTWLRWRAAAALLAGLVLLHAAGSLWELRTLGKQSAELNESVERAYGAIFPGQKPGPAPRRVLDARMKAVTGAGSPKGELMSFLSALAAARQNVPVATLESMQYKPGTLQLKMSAPTSGELEQFSQALRSGGYGAQITDGAQGARGFEGRIAMTAEGA
jgi:general secretion pathway protein L